MIDISTSIFNISIYKEKQKNNLSTTSVINIILTLSDLIYY